MSQHRISPQAGWVDAAKLPRGPNGRALCRQCGGEVPVGRRSFCGDACIHEWKIRSQPAYARVQVFKRDRGVCRLCGRDTEALERKIWAWVYHARDSVHSRRADRLLERLVRGWGRTLWQADHIVPVVEGGGECGLENLRTLCICCHKRETAALARRRARRGGRAA